MLPDQHICERARLSRDPRFDGALFVAVQTTGIYCRPVCPARAPAAVNVRYYASAAAAEEAGFRPCRRCLPEAAARVPEWCIASRTVVRALRLIDAGVVDEAGSRSLAARLGLSVRHLNRLFRDEFGATPKSLAMSRRRALAKRLIDDTDLPMAAVATQAGYGSLRRFNDDLRRCYRRTPSELRAQRRRRAVAQGGALTLRLPVRAPYNAAWVFEFLERRALAGFETVSAVCYRRRVASGDAASSWISVVWDAGALRLELPEGCPLALADLLPRVRRVFDLDAEPVTVDADLAADPLLATVIERHPGLRIPGAWDGFETAVRAILGQQVSVDRATRLAHRLLERYGVECLQQPALLAQANPAEIGMPSKRGEAIRRLAREVAAGRLQLDESVTADGLRDALCAIPGIGPWTAGYVAMRVAKDPDALPANDWVVLKMLEAATIGAPAAVRAAAAGRPGSRSDAWRPWRGYAVMYLWKLSQSARAAAAARRAGGPAWEAR
ncbi:MAG: Ada metal-binding domain-containing protein [Pseudomonadales bacterium]